MAGPIGEAVKLLPREMLREATVHEATIAEYPQESGAARIRSARFLSTPSLCCIFTSEADRLYASSGTGERFLRTNF